MDNNIELEKLISIAETELDGIPNAHWMKNYEKINIDDPAIDLPVLRQGKRIAKIGYRFQELNQEFYKLKEQNATLVEQNKQFNAERIYAQNHAALADKPLDKRVFVICNELKNLIGIPALPVETKLEYLDVIAETIDTLRIKLKDKKE